MFYSPKKSGFVFKTLRPAMSIFLSLIMIFQALGPGVFALKTASAATIVFSDGFENTPQFTNPLWEQVDPQWQVNSSSPHAGSKKAQVQGNTNQPSHSADDVLRQDQSTVGYNNIVLSYWYKTDGGLEDDDKVEVQWSENGSSWNTLFTINSSNDVETWTQKTHTLPTTAANKANFSFRFKAKLSSGNDKVFLDDVALVGDIIPAYLRVSKVVVNGDKGTKQISDFPLFVGQQSVTSGAWNSFPPGSYTVSETNQPNYSATFSGACNSEGQIVLQSGQEKTCTITNTYTPPVPTKGTLIVKKVLVNNNGGESEVTDFSFKINNGDPVNFENDGQNNIELAPGTYSVTEVADNNYITTYNNCTDLEITAGHEAICTITNDDKVKDPEPQPDPENSCLIPDTLKNTDPFVLGTSPEKTLQQILTESGHTLNAQVDQKNFQVWNLDSGAISSTFEVKLLGKYAGNDQVFGYYKKGDTSSFTPIFEVGDHSGYANPSVPVVVPGDSVTVTVPASFASSIGFALDSEGGSSQKYFSEIALNADGKDHVASYNPNTNSYVVAFEDLPIPGADQDYNDLVVKIYDVRCKQKEVICEPEKELIKNGSFEVPDVATGNYGIFPQATPGLEWFVDWVTGQTSGVLGLEIQDNVAGAPSAGSGDQFAELDGDHPVKIWQDIATVPGKEYKLSFKYSPRPGQESGTNKIEARADGALLGLLSGAGGSVTNWSSHSYNFVATDNNTEIKFIDVDADNSYGGYIDDVSLRCLPECKETKGSVVSNPDTLVTKIQIDANPETTPNSSSVVVTPTSIMVPPIWAADVGNVNAKWIWSEDPVTDWTQDKWVTFKRTFTIAGTPTSGTLKIASDNSYEVWVNGNPGTPVMVDANEDNHTASDTWDVSNLLQTGNNILEVRVKNWKLDGPALNNPGGLKFNLEWTGKDCGDNPPPPDPGSSKIHVQKYVNGTKASFTGDSAPSFGLSLSTGNYNADPSLSAPSYEWTSKSIPNNQGTVNLSETFSTTVLPNSQECAPGKFYLDGYSIGTSFADASDNATSSSPIFLQSISADQYVIVWNKSCPVPPPVSTVTACKVDDAQTPNPLSGWQLMLLGNKVQDDLSVATNVSSGVNSTALVQGKSYVANATGSWMNQGGNNPADAEYSQVNATGPWVDVYPGFISDVLELRVDQQFGSWGAYNGGHSYWRGFSPLANGPVNFGIFDGENNIQNEGWFSDNSGSLLVDIYEGYTGTTGENGCVTFTNVPYGTYTADEVLQDGWTKVSGTGSVTIDEPTETITIKNHRGVNECDGDCDNDGPTKGTLTVVKVVKNDNETANKQVSDFPLFVDAVSVVSGVSNQFNPGTYTVSETNDPAQYTATFSGDCNSSGSVTLGVGDNKTCTITNDDVPAKIVDECTTGCGGDGGDNPPGITTNGGGSNGGGSRSGDRNRGGSGSGGSVAGAFTSSVPNNPEVLGAFTGLPNTGLGPINLAEVSSKANLPQRAQNSTSATMTILIGIAMLIALNFVSIKVLKLHRK